MELLEEEAYCNIQSLRSHRHSSFEHSEVHSSTKFYKAGMNIQYSMVCKLWKFIFLVI